MGSTPAGRMASPGDKNMAHVVRHSSFLTGISRGEKFLPQRFESVEQVLLAGNSDDLVP